MVALEHSNRFMTV